MESFLVKEEDPARQRIAEFGPVLPSSAPGS